MRALRSLKGRGTVGDVVAEVGLPRNQVEGTLKQLLESHRGHLQVSDSGELVYLFDPKLIQRDRVPLLTRLKASTKRFLVGAFKAWIVVMLVVYFVVMVALVVAAIVAMMSRGDNKRGGRFPGGGGRAGRGGIPNIWLWYYLWTPRWRLGRRSYGRRWEATLPKEERPPFYKKVFGFVFGPDRPEPTREQLDRSTLRLIRARKGVLTTAELVEHNALPLHKAEEEMGRLVGAYAGEPAISRKGELVFGFPELMTSAHGPVAAKEPRPAWKRLEYPLELTGNEKKHDAVIVGMNSFTLLSGVTAPWFIFPQLGLGGTAAFIGLVIVPVVFSMLFFSVPLMRMWGVKRENRARRARNIRKLVLSIVYERALTGRGDVAVGETTEYVQRKLKDQGIEPSEVEAVIHDVAAEFDADVRPDDDGKLVFNFANIRSKFSASEQIRNRLQLENRPLGEIVYSSADSDKEEAERDKAAFDRMLTDGDDDDLDLSPYLPSPGAIGYEDDYEIVTFEEELARSVSN